MGPCLIPIALRFIRTTHSIPIPLPKLQNPSHTPILKMKMLAMMLVAVLCTVGTYGSNDEKLRKCREKISDVETKLRTTKGKEARKPLLRESIRLNTELLRLKDVKRDEDNMKQERARLQKRKQRLSSK